MENHLKKKKAKRLICFAKKRHKVKINKKELRIVFYLSFMFTM